MRTRDAIPSDDQIVAALATGGGCATYVVKNRLRGQFPRLTTKQVLARLKSLESAGRVIRDPLRTYAVMIEWCVRKDNANA